MSRIFITGSADGLGVMAAQILVKEGHQVILHGRNAGRADAATKAVPGAQAVVTGDLSNIKETVELAHKVNALGAFDAVIHNAGVGYQEPYRETVDGLPHVFAINSLAPYILTALIHRPKRLVYLSSGLHEGGDASLNDLEWKTRRWNGMQAYSDSKLHDALLAFAIARKWDGTLSNAVHPGWVATKMGGKSATDDLNKGPQTQTWLAVSEEPAAKVTGQYFFHKQQRKALGAAHDPAVQERLIAECERISGIKLPE